MKNVALRQEDGSPLLEKPVGRLAPWSGLQNQSGRSSLAKTIRFLIVPNYANHYDQRMVAGLAAALRAIGHEAHALQSPMGEIEAAPLCQQLDIDVLIQVNRFRPTYEPLPAKVRHVAWFQDIFPATPDASEFHAGDIVYTLGDPGVLGLGVTPPCLVGTLLTGVDEAGLSTALSRQRTGLKKPIDFSLCGYIPPPTELRHNPRLDLLWHIQDRVRPLPLIGRSLPMRLFWQVFFRRIRGHVPYAISSALRSAAECLYRPLCGELDIHALASAMRDIIAPILVQQTQIRRPRPSESRRGRLSLFLAPYEEITFGAQPEIDALINHFAREYPRLLDRRCLVQSALAVSDSIELYGEGWQKHPEFRPYYKGFLSVQNKLYDVYRRTRLNLANNTHGLGLHSRTLECMAVGGFIFTHASPNDRKPGGIETSFEPGVHYGVYTPETFADDARYWLANENARVQAGAKAAEIIREKHLWRHRAAQIVADLKR